MNTRDKNGNPISVSNSVVIPTLSLQSDSDLDSCESASAISRACTESVAEKRNSGSRLSRVFKRKKDKKNKKSSGSDITVNESTVKAVSSSAEAELDAIICPSIESVDGKPAEQKSGSMISKMLQRKNEKKEKKNKKHEGKTVTLEDGTSATIVGNVVTPVVADHAQLEALVERSSEALVAPAVSEKKKSGSFSLKKRLLSRIIHNEAPTLPEVNQALFPLTSTPRNDELFSARTSNSSSPRSEKITYSPRSEDDLLTARNNDLPVITLDTARAMRSRSNSVGAVTGTTPVVEQAVRDEIATRAQYAASIKASAEKNTMSLRGSEATAAIHSSVPEITTVTTAIPKVTRKISEPQLGFSSEMGGASVVHKTRSDTGLVLPPSPRSRVKDLPGPSAAYVQFAKTATNKFNSFKDHVNSVSSGKTALSSSWGEWFGMGIMSSGFAVAGGVIGLIGALGLMGGPLAAGIGLGVALAGAVATIAYSVILGQLQRREFKRAARLLDSDGLYYENNVDAMIATLQIVLDKQLAQSSRHDANLIAKASVDVLKYIIMKGKVKSFDELHSEDSMRHLLSKYATKGKNYKLDVSSATHAKSTNDILRSLAKGEAQKAHYENTTANDDVFDDELLSDPRQPLLAKTKSTPTMFGGGARPRVTKQVSFTGIPESEPLLAQQRRM